jgi:hypothetical protein
MATARPPSQGEDTIRNESAGKEMPIGLPKQQYEISRRMTQGGTLFALTATLGYEWRAGKNKASADTLALAGLLRKGVINDPTSSDLELEFPGELSSYSIDKKKRRSWK